jgi:PEP-CTERM motif
MVLQYGVGATVDAVNWQPAPGGNFNWTSPIANATAGPLDGNAAANRVAGLGGIIPGSLAPGQTLWIRWIENNDPGADHGLAIDNFTLAITPIPEPSSVALFAAGAALLGAFQMRRRGACSALR